jgi:hypothetical protein
VSHKSRPKHDADRPLLITVRLHDGLPNLRTEETFAVLLAAFEKGGDRFGFRLAHFSIQSDHMHFLAEAVDERALSRGMQGLLVRIARALNRMWSRKGSVFADHYSARELHSTRQVRRALVYVLNNASKHGIVLREPDPFTSAKWFDGWVPVDPWRDAPIPRPRTRLLADEWKQHGLLLPTERPRASRISRRTELVPLARDDADARTWH